MKKKNISEKPIKQTRSRNIPPLGQRAKKQRVIDFLTDKILAGQISVDELLAKLWPADSILRCKPQINREINIPEEISDFESVLKFEKPLNEQVVPECDDGIAVAEPSVRMPDLEEMFCVGSDIAKSLAEITATKAVEVPELPILVLGSEPQILAEKVKPHGDQLILIGHKDEPFGFGNSGREVLSAMELEEREQLLERYKNPIKGSVGDNVHKTDSFEISQASDEKNKSLVPFNSEEALQAEEKREWDGLLAEWKEFLEAVFAKEAETGAIDLDFSNFSFLRKPKGAIGVYNFIIVLPKGMTFELIFNRHKQLLPHVSPAGKSEDKSIALIKSPRNAELKSYACWVQIPLHKEGSNFKVFSVPERRGIMSAEELMLYDLFRLYHAAKMAGIKFEEYSIEMFLDIRKHNEAIGADDFAICLDYYTDEEGRKMAMVAYGWYDGKFAIKPVVIQNNLNPKYLDKFKAYRVFAENHPKLEIVYAPLS